MIGLLPLSEFSVAKAAVVLCAVIAMASWDLMRRAKGRPTHLLFSVLAGSLVSFAMLRIGLWTFQPAYVLHPVAAAAGLLVILFAWRALFGPWDAETKAVMLGTFLFWISLHIITNDSTQVASRIIAAAVALLPALVWCWLFLRYHQERIGTVVLLFLSGMLSTVPILFYDALVRRGVEMQFFFFRIRPESFSQASQQLVLQLLPTDSALGMVWATLFSFVFVALIEEVSKYWVLLQSGKRLFNNIDDVMQLSIIAAIGFAFAENVVNPVYFTAFVRDYLLHTAAPDVQAFVSNVLGRSILTTMVHIVSTGVMGYFLGLAIYARPYLAERSAAGAMPVVASALHTMLQLPVITLFRAQMLATGLTVAIVLHGLFNFLVTLPELLPGNPQSMADIIGPSAPSWLHGVPFLLLPALFYVIGGFWLLTTLFVRKTNMLDRGHLVVEEAYR